ncbi:CLUMA_CG001808, isoform A [Clunio marinus]|uniref:CLUMA_CG001808, isoform A n=1 Tax=Clunio marinus TaxID=568069 RepID=A0A1J1HNH4_9DIPT|nr:CLUMA_CG001808, isoform A [Clunio marinus]
MEILLMIFVSWMYLSVNSQYVRKYHPIKWENCPINASIQADINAPDVFMKSINFSGVFHIREDIIGAITFTIDSNKCSLDMRKCEKFFDSLSLNSFPLKSFVDVLRKNICFILFIEPPFVCPFKPGDYTLKPTILDLSITDTFRLEGFFWVVNFKLIAVSNKGKTKKRINWNEMQKIQNSLIENKKLREVTKNIIADYDQIERNQKEFKRFCRQQEERINDLVSILKTKENLSKHVGKTQEFTTIETENSTLRKKIEKFQEKENEIETEDDENQIGKLQKEFGIVKKKYDIERRLCALRLDEIEKLKADVAFLSEAYKKKMVESETLRVKYKKLKTVFHEQNNKFIEMREKCNCESVSENSNPEN